MRPANYDSATQLDMCGLVAVFDLQGERVIPEDVVRRMLTAIRHRGPDRCYVRRWEGAAFGFARLAIVDVMGGHQPVETEDGSISVLCAGEIFNYRELRRDLESKGHLFKSDTDVEVIPHLYEELGEQVFEVLNGQFAIVLYDHRKRLILAGRDHFGIQPLYHAERDGLLIVASEVKALLAHPAIRADLDLKGVAQLVHYPAVVSPRTLFRGIASLPPGWKMKGGRGAVSQEAYWDLEYPLAEDAVPPRDADLAELDDRINGAVARRLQGDDPVGLYLSGGLDSSLIAAYMADSRSPRRIRSFGVSFMDPTLDESAQQGVVAAALGLDHSVAAFTAGDTLTALGRVVWHAETPVKTLYDTASLKLSAAAREAGVKAVLTGQGADELFAGYVGYRFDAFRRAEKDHAGARGVNAPECLRLWGDGSFIYERSVEASLRLHDELFSDETIEEMGIVRTEIPERVVDVARIAGRHHVHQRSYVDVKLRLAGHLLADHGDRMAFANSVETRHPFLDRDLVDLVSRLSPDWKLRNYEDKYALRRLAEARLPGSIAHREKQGFASPASPAVMRETRAAEWVNEIVSLAEQRNLFRRSTVRTIAKKYADPSYRHQTAITDDLLALILTTELFLRTFGMS